MANFLQIFLKKLSTNKGYDPFDSSFPEEAIPIELSNNYSLIISRVIPYFNQLNESNKQKFLKRVYNFKNFRSFHYHGLDRQEEIDILISAAAVQVSFGLKNYLLPFFRDIHIVSDAYPAVDSNEVYIGHVAPNGI